MGERTLPGLTHNGWEPSQASQTAGSLVAGLTRSLRPQQWYKQLLVFVAVVFSLNATDPIAWVRSGVAAGLFCLLAGSVYLVNDVCDVEEDRTHPVKKHRPIASGQVPVPVALTAAAVLGAGAVAAGWWLSPALGAVFALYLAQNGAYNFLLREVLFADLLVLATGFVLRAVAGVVAVGAPMSPWLVICTFLAALLLGLGKRRAEAQKTQDADEARATLEGYDPEFTKVLLGGVAAALMVAYSLYTFDARTATMMVTIPFAIYAVFRYLHLVFAEDLERPERLLADRGMVGNLALWTASVVVVLYWLPTLGSLPGGW